MPSQTTPSPLAARSRRDCEHMMKLLVALNRALDSNKNADAHESRRR